MVEGSSATASLRRKIGSTQVLTCEAKLVDSKLCELRKALDDKVDVGRWEHVAANEELLERLELRHGPRQGCGHN